MTRDESEPEPEPASARDVVLVTVDCWRHDALAEMSNLRALTADYGRADAICGSSATRGAFPAILAGQYYPQVYEGFDTVRPGVEPLPELLSAAGYETGAFLASNPFLAAWDGVCDTYWNDELEVEADTGLSERLAVARSKARHAANYLRLHSRVPVEDVAARAESWYDAVDGPGYGPRFLWIHLMDVHAPFFPGLGRGLRAGLLDAYRSHYRFFRQPDALTEADKDVLEGLYWRCVERLDERVGALFDVFDDDALVVVLGDHGEEFHHDRYGHARLYDETVRVPLLANGPLADRVDAVETVRQIDLPATILDALGLAVPDHWEGEPLDGTERTAFILNHSPLFGRVYTGVRTPEYKLVRTAEESGEHVRTEAYDLQADPDETDDIYGDSDAVAALEDELDAFLAREDIGDNLLEHDTDGASQVVEDRLEALGYR